MRKYALWASACVVIALTTLAFGATSVEAGTLEERPEVWNRWEDCYRADGPGARFNDNRSAKVGAYFATVNNASIARSVANYAALLKLVEDLKDPQSKNKAQENYQNALKKNNDGWVKAEQTAYDALVRGIRQGYRIALAERTNEYRTSRKTLSCSFHLRALTTNRPKGNPRGYDGVSGSLRHSRVEEGEGFRLEWEVADESVYNPDAHHLSGVFHKKSVVPINDARYVGIDFFFEARGPELRFPIQRRYQYADGSPWCAFKLTEQTCVEQARRDMGGITDEQLETCQILLDQAGFKRHTLENQQ